MSAFDAWFLAQHGKRPHHGPSDKALQEAIASGKRAEQMLADRLAWDARHESALYAWQIKDADKAAFPKGDVAGTVA